MWGKMLKDANTATPLTVPQSWADLQIEPRMHTLTLAAHTSAYTHMCTHSHMHTHTWMHTHRLPGLERCLGGQVSTETYFLSCGSRSQKVTVLRG